MTHDNSFPIPKQSITGCGFAPTLHPDYPIGMRVRVPVWGGQVPDEPLVTGTITGIASIDIVFTYIITLDEPLPNKSHKDWITIPVWGTLIKPESETTDEI